MPNAIELFPPQKCAYCKIGQLDINVIDCPVCGYPQGASKIEKDNFLAFISLVQKTYINGRLIALKLFIIFLFLAVLAFAAFLDALDRWNRQSAIFNTEQLRIINEDNSLGIIAYVNLAYGILLVLCSLFGFTTDRKFLFALTGMIVWFLGQMALYAVDILYQAPNIFDKLYSWAVAFDAVVVLIFWAMSRKLNTALRASRYVNHLFVNPKIKENFLKELKKDHS